MDSPDRDRLLFRLQLLGWHADDLKYTYAIEVPVTMCASSICTGPSIDKKILNYCSYREITVITWKLLL